MKMRSLLIISCVSAVLVGCGPNKPAADPAKSSASDLKELKKEDLVVGKPTDYFPKMEPSAIGDRVYVRYKGQLKNGMVFDQNIEGDKDAYGVTIGNHEVIEGWERGLIGMLPGGKRRLSIPWKMAYGESGSETIPAKSDLFFEVELVDMVKAGSEATYSIKDRTVGTGPVAKAGSTVTVEYEVRVAGSSQEYDSSKKQGAPQSYKIGSGKAFPAIEDATIGMKVGGVRDVWLPPAVGIKTNMLPGFPEDAIQIVKLKLLAVK